MKINSKKIKLGLISLATAAVLIGCSKPEPMAFSDPYLTRDVRDDVFYFVMPDRFYNGDLSNDEGSKSVAISAGGFDPASPAHFHGGDIQGLIKKLDYLKDMGISAIWLTPILRNQAVQGNSAGYHGYWPVDFTEIDPHLGSNKDLKDFIDAAHRKNIKVFFDIITNHTADVVKFEECHGDNKPQFSTSGPLCPYRSLKEKREGNGYTPYVPAELANVKSPAWLNDVKYYHNQGDSTWEGENSVYGDFLGLDDIDTDNPEVVTGMVNIFSNLIAEFKPDGFRIDTVKHVNVEFWQAFTPAIIDFAKSVGIPNFFVFGEVYSGDPKVLSYYTTVGDMPSVLDFAFQFHAKDVFALGQGTTRLTELFNQDALYLDHNSSPDYLMNFISNHDVGRFAYTLNQARPGASEQERLARIKLANAFMFFARGIPVIYYGDEQGFVGYGGDRGARENMMPSKVAQYNEIDLIGTDKTTADDNFDTAHPLYQAFQQYAQLYHGHKALRQGRQELVQDTSTPGIFALRRVLNEQRYLVVFNSAESDMSMTYSSTKSKLLFGDASIEGQTIKLPALSFAIIQE